jgi:hypothetical protein
MHQRPHCSLCVGAWPQYSKNRLSQKNRNFFSTVTSLNIGLDSTPPLFPFVRLFSGSALEMASAMRSLAPFLRVARSSFRQNTNPLVSLQRQSRSPALFARTYAVYTRDKPHVNIGMALHLQLNQGMHSDSVLRRHNWSRRSRKGSRSSSDGDRDIPLTQGPDNALSRHHQEASREGSCELPRLWLHRQGSRGAQAWYHHLHGAH